MAAQLEGQVLDKIARQLYIFGQWRDAASGSTLRVEDPSTQETLCEIASAQPEDAAAALDAACAAQDSWRGVPPPRARREALLRWSIGRQG